MAPPHLQIQKSAHDSVLPHVSPLTCVRAEEWVQPKASRARKNKWDSVLVTVFESLGQLALTPDSPWIRGSCRELVDCKGFPAKARKGAKVHFVGLGASRHLPRGRAIFLLLLFSLLLFSHKGLSSHILTQESFFPFLRRCLLGCQ